jgi:predicted ATPase/DNA-binding SARP family transcriptional activator
MNEPWKISLLGGLRAQRGDEVVTRFRTQKTASLLAYLACFGNRSHPREELVELLWPDTELEAGRSSLRTALSSLRHVIEPPDTRPGSVLDGNRASVWLNRDTVSVDLADLETTLRSAATTEDTAARIPLLIKADELYRGPLLPGFYDDWALRERERWEQAFVGGLHSLVTALEQTGDLRRAIEYAQRAVSVNPMLEESHRHVIRLYAAAGEPAAALRQFEELTTILERDLGEKPSAATRALIDTLRRDEAAPAKPVRGVPLVTMGNLDTAKAGGLASPPGRAVAASLPRLPLPLTRFYGRDEDIALLEQALTAGDTRLVTLTGPGGSGKTRLSLEVARRLTHRFVGSTYFVDLIDVADPDLLLGAIMDALRLPRSATADPLEQAARILGRQPSLLVLDNFERLIDGGAQILGTLLESTPRLICLVTSRQRLELGGEQEFPVSPLPIPAKTAVAQQLLESPAVQLYIDRARSARSDFRLTDENAAAVADLCLRLEGIPLAIELAAAWASVLTPAQILARLEKRFEILESRRKDISPRHRSLRTAIEGSYEQLPPDLRRFFARLSVFRGGWTLADAEGVCEEPNALEYLRQLRERSLVLVTDAAGNETRYAMLETLREFAAEQLTAVEQSALRRRHVAHFLDVVERGFPLLYGPDQVAWMDHLEGHHDNLRAALAWSQTEPGQLDRGIWLVMRLYYFWGVRGYAAEAYPRVRQLLAVVEAAPTGEVPSADRAALLHAAGALVVGLGDHAAARDLLQRSLDIRRGLGNPPGTAGTLCHLGYVLDCLGEHAAARPLFEESMASYREMEGGGKGGVAHVLKCLGDHARMQGDIPQAQTWFGESLDIYREIGDRRGISMILGELGELALPRQEYQQAAVLFQEALILSRELRDNAHTAQALFHLGLVAHRQGDLDAACSYLAQSLTLRRELGNVPETMDTLAELGRVALDQQELDAAEAYLGESLELRRGLAGTPGVADILELLAAVAAERGQADRAGHLAGAAQTLRGAATPPALHGSRAAALRALDTVRVSVGNDAFTAALKEGESMTREQAVTYALAVLARSPR